MKPRNFSGRVARRRYLALFQAEKYGRAEEAAVLRSRIPATFDPSTPKDIRIRVGKGGR